MRYATTLTHSQIIHGFREPGVALSLMSTSFGEAKLALGRSGVGLGAMCSGARSQGYVELSWRFSNQDRQSNECVVCDYKSWPRFHLVECV